jgi:hypothetical protein
MVRAILDGRKTQTRRVIKPQVEDKYWFNKMNHASIWNPRDQLPRFCPFGQAGDQLWVRETWATLPFYNHIKPSKLISGHKIYYRAKPNINDSHYMWRPSIYMPRWASRITLEIVKVRVERVQEISEDDALAEGCRAWVEGGKETDSTVSDYAQLWNEINLSRGFGWDVNPWVWVLDFKALEVQDANQN